MQTGCFFIYQTSQVRQTCCVVGTSIYIPSRSLRLVLRPLKCRNILDSNHRVKSIKSSWTPRVFLVIYFRVLSHLLFVHVAMPTISYLYNFKHTGRPPKPCFKPRVGRFRVLDPTQTRGPHESTRNSHRKWVDSTHNACDFGGIRTLQGTNWSPGRIIFPTVGEFRRIHALQSIPA